MLPLDGERKPRRFLQTPFHETMATLSPDGRWLAYVSDESSRREVYVQSFPGLPRDPSRGPGGSTALTAGGKWQISTEGGTEPVWARNGKELFYWNGAKMMAVDITTQPTFSAGTPRLLFEGRYERSRGFRANYDVTPDGERFVMVRAGEQEWAATQVNVVLEWFEELKRRAPPGNK